jgi:hypothetical protein
MSMNSGPQARLHTLENFSIEKREKRLFEVLESHLSK